MSKGGIAVLVVAALVFAALGFVFGQVVQAAGNNPGPLVSQSWVEKYVGEKLADMQQKIDELEAQLLQNGIAVNTSGDAAIPEPVDNTQTPTTPTTPATSTTPAPTTVKVKSSSVNVRSDASTSASVVGSVSAETILTYLDKKTDSSNQVWYKVRLDNGTEGWVAGWLCYEPQ